jgi:O-antigen ligase
VQAIWCVVLGSAVILAAMGPLDRKDVLCIGLVGAIGVLWVAIIAQQIWTRGWLPDPAVGQLWATSGQALGGQAPVTGSVVRNQPLFAVGPQLIAVLSLVCGYLHGRDPGEAGRLLKVLAWSGVVYAVFGIVTFAIDPTMVLWRRKLAYANVLTSTFINRNTAALYFGCCATIWFLYFASSMQRVWRSARLADLFSEFFARPPRKAVLAVILALLLASAMLMTRSRAGTVLSMAGIAVSFLVFFRDRFSRAGSLLGAGLTVVVSSAAIIEIFASGLSSRFELQGLADGGRFEVYRSTLAIIRDYPWSGTGLGTFAWIFPGYRTDSISSWGTWDRAHSTPLEIAAEQGLIFCAAVLLAWLLVFLLLIRGVRQRRGDKLIVIAALTVAAISCFHSLIDFSLQIPGFTLPILAVVGAGLAQSVAPPRRKVTTTG